MSNLEVKVDTLMRLCTACDEETREEAREEIRFLLQGKKTAPTSADPEYLTRQILLELGAPDHLLGHPYVVQAVLLATEDWQYISRIVRELYPALAVQFDTTPSRVERTMRHLIEVTWTRGDLEVLNRYFGNTVSAEKGKPTNGEFIARIANVVKTQMKQ